MATYVRQVTIVRFPAMPRMIRKSDLPQKTCACCARPFTWRRKWAKDWDQVKYCSDACRRGKVPDRTGGTEKRH